MDMLCFDSNGTKWVIETDIFDSSLSMVIIMAIEFESFSSWILFMPGGTVVMVPYGNRTNTYLLLHRYMLFCENMCLSAFRI